MPRGDWMEHGVAWDGIAGDDGTEDDEPTISFVNDFKGGACRNWTEHGVAWDDVARNDGTGDDEPTIPFVDDLKGGAGRGCGRDHAERVLGSRLRKMHAATGRSVALRAMTLLVMPGRGTTSR